jgi:glutamate N-acetyltransferase/amino-acid N-acetyltransferase
MSTNDMALIMANGSLKNTPLAKGTPVYRKFTDALKDLTYDLAKMIVEDGEGATKFIEIIVKGAGKEADALKAAASVANSMLVKTAIYGKDPNWGRIIAAVGYSGIDIKEENIDIYLNNIKLVTKGVGAKKEEIARDMLSNKHITITINLNSGNKSAKVLTCDLTEKYIEINAHYTT